MAIWQFDVSLVPAGGSVAGREHAPLNAAEILFLHRLLAATTPKVSNIDGDAISYGYADGNRIDLMELARGRHAAWIAIDARSDCDYFCRLVCQLARVLNCELFSPEFETTLSPTRRGLLSGLMKSFLTSSGTLLNVNAPLPTFLYCLTTEKALLQKRWPQCLFPGR